MFSPGTPTDPSSASTIFTQLNVNTKRIPQVTNPAPGNVMKASYALAGKFFREDSTRNRVTSASIFPKAIVHRELRRSMARTPTMALVI